ncbi:glycoside hydrolase family protein [Ochrovirga pacifica]|uniref:glycoside hydrolase family protein n=1 Tax=Ochrovirga pacifica TaxID=1042376 RepID=UPI0002557B63|nr:glycoside hydrolase family protein [Ochrovirga pacifica]
MKIKSLVVCSVLACIFAACQSQKTVLNNYQDISFQPLDTTAVANFFNHKKQAQVLVEPGYYVWGLSVVQWEGKYHAYYARWKKEYEHKGWMTHCEIAHAVADAPQGPFEFVNVVLESKKQNGWDANNAHNPYAVVADGKIALYYIANDLGGLFQSSDTLVYPDQTWFDAHRMEVRDRQRIGVALANNPNGPFVRSEKVVVAPDDVLFKKIAVNPAVIYKDKQYKMIVKGDDLKHKKPFRIQLVGNADSPEGPFEFHPEPVYAKAQTEDATLWYDTILKKYFMVCHVMGKRDLALFSSTNGKAWQEDKRSVFMKKEFVLTDGTVWKPKRVERPFVLTDKNGQPIMIYVAVYDKNVNGNIAIPIQWNSQNK